MLKGNAAAAFSLVLLCLTASSVICLQPVNAQYQGDIMISADGSVNPQSAPIRRCSNLYTLISDVKGSITIYQSNIILDGNGCTVSSLELQSIHNATLKDFSVTMRNQFNEMIGISIINSSNNFILNNTVAGFNSIYALNGIYFGGIYILGGNSNSFVSNHIVDNLAGMTFVNTSYNLIAQNNVLSNVPYSSLINFVRGSNNTVYHNNFFSIADQARTYFSVASWDNGSASGGNYWSDYNGNGAYVIDQDNVDNYPLAKPFDIYQQPALSPITPSPTATHSPPTDRNPRHLDPIIYLIPISVIVTIIILSALLFRRSRKTSRLKKPSHALGWYPPIF